MILPSTIRFGFHITNRIKVQIKLKQPANGFSLRLENKATDIHEARGADIENATTMIDHPNLGNVSPTIGATLISVSQSIEGDLQLRSVVPNARPRSGRKSEHGLLHFDAENEATEYLHELEKHFGVDQQHLALVREKGLDQFGG